MKKMVTAGIVMFVLSFVVSTPALAAIEVEGDAYIGIFDKYMWRGFDLSAAQPVAQGGVDLSAKGFTLSVWSNVQLSDGNSVSQEIDWLPSNEVTETDITLDYTHEFDLLSVSVGDIFYNFNGAGASTHELYLGLAANIILSPTLTAYYDWDLSNDNTLNDDGSKAYEGNGLYYTFGVSHSLDLMEKLSVDFGASVSYNDESPYVSNTYTDWHNYELNVGANYAVTDQISISPSFLFSEGLSDKAKKTIDSETVGGLTVTLTF